MTKAQYFLEKFNPDIQKDVDKWAKSIPAYDEIADIGKEFWDKAKEITMKKMKEDPNGDYWATFFAVLDDMPSGVRI